MRVAAAVLVAPMLAACVEHRTIDLPFDAYAFEYGFIALINDAGFATRASPPFGVADGRLTFGALPLFQLEPDESEVLLVGLPEGALRRAAPKFDETRAAELELLLSVSTKLPFFAEEALALGVEVPAEARVMRGELDSALEEAAAPADFALKIPIAPERCSRATEPGLEPYGATADIVEGNREGDADNFFFIDQLDERALVAMTPKFFHLFGAGETYQPSPVTLASGGNRLGGEAMPNRYTFGGYTRDSESDTVWLAATAAPVEQPETLSEGLLLELAVDPTRIAIVRTASLSTTPLVAVALDLDRKPVVLAGKGRVLRYDEGFVDLPPITSLVGDEFAFRLHATGDPKYRYLASSTGQVHVFNADTQSWESFRVPISWLRDFPEDSYNANGLASAVRSDGRLELWAAGTSSVLIHRIDAGPWEEYPIELPPSFVGCAVQGEYPNLSYTAGLDSIEIVGPDLFVSVRACSGVLQIRPSEECTAAIGVGSVPPSFLFSDLQAVDVLGGTLVLGGEDGLLYRTTLR